MLQSFTSEKQGVEKVIGSDIIPSQTSIEIETELLGNGEDLYDVMGQRPMKITANVEEENDYSVLVKPPSHITGIEKLGLQSTEGKYFEFGSCDCEEKDEDRVIQTHNQDAAAKSGEYSMNTIKKSVDIDEIVPPSNAYSLTLADEEDTVSSPGFEEGSNDGSLSYQATHQSSKPPVAEDFSKEVHVEGGSSNKRKMVVPPTKSVTKTPQEEKFPEYATVAMNHKTKKPKNAKVLEGIYDVVVNQLAARKASSSTPSHVEPYAVCTLPALSKVPQYQCAVGKSSPETDEEYKHSKVASE